MTEQSRTDSPPAGQDAKTFVEAGWALFGVAGLLGLVFGRSGAASDVVRSIAAVVLTVAAVLSIVRRRWLLLLAALAGVCLSVLMVVTT